MFRKPLQYSKRWLNLIMAAGLEKSKCFGEIRKAAMERFGHWLTSGVGLRETELPRIMHGFSVGNQMAGCTTYTNDKK